MSKNNLFSKILQHMIFIVFFTINIFPALAQSSEEISDWTQPLQKCWEVSLEDMSNITLASDNELLYIPAINKIKALNTSDGNMIWETEIKGLINGKLLLDNELLLVSSEQEDQKKSLLTILNSKTGIPYKQINLDSYPASIQTVFNGNLIITNNNNINAINLNTEDLIFKSDTLNKIYFISSPENSRIYLGSKNETLIELSLSDGRISRQININNNPTYIFYFRNFEQIIIGYKDGTVNSFNNNLKKTWDLKFGGEITDIKNFKENLLISSKDNFMYSVKAVKGNNIWKLKLPGRIVGSILINQETLLIVSFGSESAILINPQNGRVINKIDFEKDTYFVSQPVYINYKVIIPTNRGIKAFSQSCSQKGGM
ncbi:MAG: PQQ-binding-like beta-propeller repeat protein [Aridibacter sp.]